MMMSAVVAVALGLTPVKDSASPQLVTFDEAQIARQVGRYRQFTGKDGKTHLRGFDRLGRAYDLAIDPGLLSTTDRVYVLAANAKWKVGYSSKFGGGLTHAFAAPSELRHV